MMGEMMLIRKVTTIAEMVGEKDQAAQLSSHVPLADMLVAGVQLSLGSLWFDFPSGVIQSIARCSAGRHCANQGLPSPSFIPQRLKPETKFLFTEYHCYRTTSWSTCDMSSHTIRYGSS